MTETRLHDLRQLMARQEIDLVALGPSSHMKWLAGLNPHGDERPVMLLVSAGFAGLLMPALNAASCREQTDLPFFEWSDEDGPEAALDALLTASGVARTAPKVALDETMRTDFSLLLLQKFETPEPVFTHSTVGQLRALKDRSERAALQESAGVNDLAFAAAVEALQTDVTEQDISEVVFATYKEHGATPAFCIVAFGPNTAFPHHHTGSTVLAPDMPVLIDAGCLLGGYRSDMTRCGWFGRAPQEYGRVAEVLEGAVQAALAASRSGAMACEIDRAARDVINAAGYGPQFLHRTGHGLGLDGHEPPYITATARDRLEAGHVYTIEPGIYLEGRFGIRLEDCVFLHEEGPEVFTKFPRRVFVKPA